MLNWVFGTKRRPSPEVYVSEETADVFRNQHYESPLPPYPPIPRPDGPRSYPYAAPYPPMPAQYPPTPAQPYTIPTPYPQPSNYDPARTTATNPLDSIPFILAPSLTIARTQSNAEIDSIRSQMRQIKDKLEKNYNYDFSLETSVIREIRLTCESK